MAQWVKCLLHKCNYLSYEPQNPCKSQSQRHSKLWLPNAPIHISPCPTPLPTQIIKCHEKTLELGEFITE